MVGIIEEEYSSAIWDGSASDRALWQQQKELLQEAVTNRNYGQAITVLNRLERILPHKLAFEDIQTIKKAKAKAHKAQQKQAHEEAIARKIANGKIVEAAVLSQKQKVFSDLLGKIIETDMPRIDVLNHNVKVMRQALKPFTNAEQFLKFCQNFPVSIGLPKMVRVFIKEYNGLNKRTKGGVVDHGKIIRFYNYSKSPATHLVMVAINKFMANIPTREERTIRIKGILAMAKKSKATRDEQRVKKLIDNKVLEDLFIKYLETGKPIMVDGETRNPDLYNYSYKRAMNYTERFLYDNLIRFKYNVGMTYTSERDRTTGRKVHKSTTGTGNDYAEHGIKWKSCSTKVTDAMIEAEYEILRSYGYKYHGKEYQLSGYKWKNLAKSLKSARAKKIVKLLEEKKIDFLAMKRRLPEIDDRLCNFAYDEMLSTINKNKQNEIRFIRLSNLATTQPVNDRITNMELRDAFESIIST